MFPTAGERVAFTGFQHFAYLDGDGLNDIVVPGKQGIYILRNLGSLKKQASALRSGLEQPV